MVLIFCLLVPAGCGNLSPRLNPRLDEKIDNANGKIGDISNEQNGLKAELLKLQNRAEITDSKLDRIQQGVVNLQSNTSYSGVQILSGQGGMLTGVTVFVLVCFLAIYFQQTSRLNAKAADMLAENIVNQGDPDLQETLLRVG